jgi:AraC-like DNA-binding protein
VNEDSLLNTSDPLSTALTTVKLRAFMSVALDAGGEWAVDFPAYEGITLNVVQKGECWLAAGDSRKVRLRSGDCFLLTGGKPFTLATDLSRQKRGRAEELYMDAKDGIAVCNGGGQFFVVGIIFRFQGHLPPLLFGRLPAVIHIDGSSDQAAAFRWSLDRFNTETRNTGLGRSLILSHLAPIMLLQMLRLYLSSSPPEENWLRALAHPRLSKVLEAMQTQYKRRWSLNQLAEQAKMSRSGFAMTFKRVVGISPLSYLANWRMQMACELLQAGEENLACIAAQVGYDSESAFSSAFNRIVKCRPGAYRSISMSPVTRGSAR